MQTGDSGLHRRQHGYGFTREAEDAAVTLSVTPGQGFINVSYLHDRTYVLNLKGLGGLYF